MIPDALQLPGSVLGCVIAPLHHSGRDLGKEVSPTGVELPEGSCLAPKPRRRGQKVWRTRDWAGSTISYSVLVPLPHCVGSEIWIRMLQQESLSKFNTLPSLTGLLILTLRFLSFIVLPEFFWLNYTLFFSYGVSLGPFLNGPGIMQASL